MRKDICCDTEHVLKLIDNRSIRQTFINQLAINLINVNQNIFEKCFIFLDEKRKLLDLEKNYGLDNGSEEQIDEYSKTVTFIFIKNKSI
ncbi:unnamed protein product [Rotaria sp. Silwood2]|nr:unnamed protein product [Rotaria sp. Silwood2]CAF2476251.1 unnamed protein product [Rotaria sp. Silwood2]CAF2710971.1 unnamed protein product [Rotaria sp. Silwood2]CAF2861750.1 unnamed protein product [Rotaria sp. Silwood2]CAF3897299.1 unnamed protein product [Rotaria sp. Silwood2]